MIREVRRVQGQGRQGEALSAINRLRMVCGSDTAAVPTLADTTVGDQRNRLADGKLDATAVFKAVGESRETSKLALLERLLPALIEEGKLVIACQYMRSLDLLQQLAARLGYGCMRLDGKVHCML